MLPIRCRFRRRRVAEPVRFKRAALIVANLDRALVLYRDALGLTLQSIKNSPVDSYSYEIFGIDPAARLRMAALDGPAGQERTLALIEVTPPRPRPAQPGNATVIWVADMDAALAGIARAPGVTIHPERALHTHDGKVGREVGLIDADGHAVVVYHV
jgi:catechol 2,3-dioxygenase-like lactoylglutathione lyase family enzyme